MGEKFQIATVICLLNIGLMSFTVHFVALVPVARVFSTHETHEHTASLTYEKLIIASAIVIAYFFMQIKILSVSERLNTFSKNGGILLMHCSLNL